MHEKRTKQQTAAAALELAQRAAQEAGAVQMDYLMRGFQINSKSSSVDMVTEVDKRCEQLIRRRILENFPDHCILGEEEGTSGENSTWCWVIDPLDGTSNYVHGHPIFCVSIALCCNGSPEVAVVHVPKLKDTYTAIRSQGAKKNGIKLTVSSRNRLSQSLMATGVPYDRATSRNNNVDYIAAMIPRLRGLRRLGAAAYDLCLVAEGVYEAYWEQKIRPWDVAAGTLMVREAMGSVWLKPSEGYTERDMIWTCCASNGCIDKELEQALSTIGPVYNPPERSLYPGEQG